MPLVRDCSCRGDSAGFAHLSCLEKYTEQKCKHAVDGNTVAFSEPWHKCNNCRQPFQGQLAIDLAACVSFAEATYGHPSCSKWDKLKVIESLRLKIDALNKLPHADVEELNDKLMTIIDQTKTKYKMSSWIHMPKTSNEYQYYIALCGNYEAFAHLMIGLSVDLTKEGKQVAIGHFKKASAICNLVGMTDKAKHLDTLISVHTAEKQTENDQNLSTNVAAE